MPLIASLGIEAGTLLEPVASPSPDLNNRVDMSRRRRGVRARVLWNRLRHVFERVLDRYLSPTQKLIQPFCTVC